MNGLRETFARDQRIAILRLLADQADYRASVSVLQDALDHVGHRVSRTEAIALAEWLRDAGLVTIADVSATIRVLELTQRGEDVARGRTAVDGVKRPRPGT